MRQRLIDVWTGRLHTCIQAIGGHFYTHCDSLNSKNFASLVNFAKFIVNQLHCFRLFIVIDIHISQGSVATRLRCGGIFNDNFIISLFRSLIVKEF